MHPDRVPPEELLGKCCWCGKDIPEDTPVFGMGGRKRGGADLSGFEGAGVRISLVTQDRAVNAIVPAADSQARRDGRDFMFMVCSEQCAAELKSVLQEEISLGDALFDGIEEMAD
jgi:hypothetical protein